MNKLLSAGFTRLKKDKILWIAMGALLLYALLREKAHKQLIAKGRNPDCPETPPYPDSPGHVDDSISAVFGNADKKK